MEAVVETLGGSSSGGESLAMLAHDARNMVTALGLYCDLLEEPGVLAVPYLHYGNELRLVAAASRRLVEKLVALDNHSEAHSDSPLHGQRDGGPASRPKQPYAGNLLTRAESGNRSGRAQRWDPLPTVLINNLATELLANRNLLAALAGPAIALTVRTEAGALAVNLSGEDLTRVLVNLVKNSAEAMPAGGKIELSLREKSASPPSVLLTIEDSGPGFPARMLDKMFEGGFSTQPDRTGNAGWPPPHRGLGLSISRSILEAAGGHIVVANRSPAGARLEIDLPARTP
jgi:signal transduction histidine kinase